MPTIGLFHSTVRAEEKLIIRAAREKKAGIKLIDIRNEVFNPLHYRPDFDIALERSVSTVKGGYATEFLEALGAVVINPSGVARICEDKFLTSLALQKTGVPTLKFAMAFSLEQAMAAVADLGGFPVVVKPPLGSWGRMLAKVNDRDSLEAIIEHKDVLGSPQQKAYYLQEYIQKPGRDIRSFVVGGETICAIYRTSSHWITNTALGGKATNCPVTKELSQLSLQAAKAVRGGILAIDIIETSEGLKVNEINHTMEFKNSEEPTGVSISGAIVDYCLQKINSND
ncbi:lysine biosynthesis protein LysX [Candidatus Shapirobacteria bacterium CG03_land_8_20_14_0_80_40_19]|uniref:Lysine biosynthesis protein LysX n=3 Tax=Candidatus Shapironibacteriota TaxID=1752721 RepID=A0A2M7BDZ1_9BACT|nr:MAG: lysine biosynthesis protein LysX [Candidatus Shapirobacteria bacterium CG11_big_fil_rev_8_21_14_0_20_40_12]PIV01306.1 MAG: lysine biosynthesis protein LysX [Candidatus Shapirobacteria bacterium CG03_land_8_20_14_0_80_40_19]PJC29182.1 MAG: lysine biosynthesis protein LysX [Candidatus Shapirobacteria bacterium CG_4_9_14_0_2_um_filter_40_11]